MRPEPERPFDEPWQARAFALAVVTVDRLGLPWDTFRARLKSAIAEQPQRPYWESWLAALEDLALLGEGVASFDRPGPGGGDG